MMNQEEIAKINSLYERIDSLEKQVATLTQHNTELVAARKQPAEVEFEATVLRELASIQSSLSCICHTSTPKKTTRRTATKKKTVTRKK